MERIQINLQENKKAYFAGDFHFGIPDEIKSTHREKKVIEWLESIEDHTQELFLCKKCVTNSLCIFSGKKEIFVFFQVKKIRIF